VVTGRYLERVTAASRRVPRHVLAVLLVLAAVAGVTWMAVGDRWKSNVAFFDLDHANKYRLRVTGTGDVRCAKLEYETFNDPYANWREAGRDCAWPRVADGAGWLAGGGIEQVFTRGLGTPLPEVILYGIVPGTATTVEITLDQGPPRPITTIGSGHADFRVYAVHVPDAGDRAEVVALRLRDANGGELRVY
jgi:hypothetical protein